MSKYIGTPPSETSEALSTYPRSRKDEVCVGTLNPLIIIASGAPAMTTFRTVVQENRVQHC